MRTNNTSHLGSIFSVKMVCTNCGWIGTVGECEPDVDGEGSLGCPKCLEVVQENHETHYTN